MNRSDVYSLIDGERAYQDSQSLGANSNFTVGEELVLLATYVDEALKAWTYNSGDFKALEKVRKVAAIAVRCMEHHPTPPR